jgi:hypothetical protein
MDYKSLGTIGIDWLAVSSQNLACMYHNRFNWPFSDLYA